MASARISAKGWVVIPAPLRKKYRLQPGDQVRIVDYGGGLALVPALGDPIEEAQGMVAGPTSLVEALLSQRAEDRQSDIDGRTYCLNRGGVRMIEGAYPCGR